jgi:hypothetical protein
MNIFVIAIIGIAIFSSVIFGFFMTGENPLIQFPRPEHYEIEITGLKDSYLVGEIYSFSYILSGYGSACGTKLITFPINKTANLTEGSSASCLESNPIDFVLDAREVYGRSYGHVALQEPGNYTVTVWFEKGDNGPTIAKKSFLVLEHSFSKIEEISSYKGKDCNVFLFADVNCFADSFNDCIPARIENMHPTVEGDPIYSIAMIKSNEDKTSCSIVVFEDTTKDRFGVPGITKYTCSSMKLEDNYLNLSPCVNESNNGEYGFIIWKP